VLRRPLESAQAATLLEQDAAAVPSLGIAAGDAEVVERDVGVAGRDPQDAAGVVRVEGHPVAVAVGVAVDRQLAVEHELAAGEPQGHALEIGGEPDRVGGRGGIGLGDRLAQAEPAIVGDGIRRGGHGERRHPSTSCAVSDKGVR
jgi:hypothetical protein